MVIGWGSYSFQRYDPGPSHRTIFSHHHWIEANITEIHLIKFINFLKIVMNILDGK
jgi:hypothetical protein